MSLVKMLTVWQLKVELESLHKLKFYPSVLLLMINMSQSAREKLDSYCKIFFWGETGGGGWAIFCGMNFFFSPLGCACFFFVGSSLCKNFLKSKTQDLDSRKHLLNFFSHGSPCTIFLTFFQQFLLCRKFFREIAQPPPPVSPQKNILQ